MWHVKNRLVFNDDAWVGSYNGSWVRFAVMKQDGFVTRFNVSYDLKVVSDPITVRKVG